MSWLFQGNLGMFGSFFNMSAVMIPASRSNLVEAAEAHVQALNSSLINYQKPPKSKTPQPPETIALEPDSAYFLGSVQSPERFAFDHCVS